MPAALDALAVDGRIVVLAYQSLEGGGGTASQRVFAEGHQRPEHRSDLRFELPGHSTAIHVLTRRCERAGDARGAQNPRSAAVATACPTTRATETEGSEEGRLMKANAKAKTDPRRRSSSWAERTLPGNAGRRADDPTHAGRKPSTRGKASAQSRDTQSRSAPQTTTILRPVERPRRPRARTRRRAVRRRGKPSD